MSGLLVACDLDGTLTFARRAPDPVVMTELVRLSECTGVRLVIATARSARSVRQWFPGLAGRIDAICCNGAMTAGGVVDRRPLPERALRRALRRLDREGVGYCLEYGSHFLATGLDVLPWMGAEHRVVRTAGGGVDLASVLKCSVADATAAHRAARRLPGIAVVPHASGDADLMASGVSKAAAVARLRRPGERVVAFGNDHNDLSMLEEADRAFVVGDGLAALDRRGHIRRVPAEPDAVATALAEVTSGVGLAVPSALVP